MFNSGILDVVIGVIVIFLQLSLVCTAVNELIALMLKKRAKELEKGIGKLLTNPQLVDKFYAHPLIKGLRPDERKPSYIPARTFSMALMDIVRRASFDGSALVAAANHAVVDKEKLAAAAQADVEAADKAVGDATKVREAADAAVLVGGAADIPAALKFAQDAAGQEAAAKAQQVEAQAKLAAAQKAKTDADAYVTQVTSDVNAAQTAEADARAAEASAAAKPSNSALQTAAVAARKTADAAADKLAPSAAGLLTDARAQVAGVQSDLIPPQLKTALLALMDNAGSSLNKAHANLEQWFDDAMDRVSGVYKRKSQVVIVIIAVLVTLLSNVDTLQVADSLTHDKAVRDSLVAAAPELAKKAEPTAAAAPAKSPEGQGAAGGAGTQGAGAAGASLSTTSSEPSITSIKASLDELNKLGLPIGYVRVCTPLEETVVEGCVTSAETQARIEANEPKEKVAKEKLAAADTELTTAKGKLAEAIDANSKTIEANKAATQAVVSKAQESADALQTARNTAAAEQAKVQDVLQKDKARLTEFSLLQSKLQTAEDEAKKKPEDEKLQQAVREARRRVEFAAKCPKCRKGSSLTAAQLRQRMPTTHDYQPLNQEFFPALVLSRPKEFFPAIGALIGDSWNLLYAHWLGWLITALAISLGAPFWFDMLNRVMVIRSTVKPHEKSREQESKDNPDEPDEKKKKT